MTNNLASDAPQKTAAEMLQAMDEAFAAPTMIGSIMGMPVYVDGRLPDRMVEIRTKDQTIRFRADHAYLDGTKLATVARAHPEKR